MKDLVRLWLELLDYGSERGISDDQYMGIADRFTAWMCRLCEPATFTPDYVGPRTRGAERKRLWRERTKEKARSHE